MSKWEVVYSTEDIENFYRAKAKLDELNISFKTDTISSGGGQGGGYGFASIYHVKVKTEDTGKAQQILND